MSKLPRVKSDIGDPLKFNEDNRLKFNSEFNSNKKTDGKKKNSPEEVRKGGCGGRGISGAKDPDRIAAVSAVASIVT